jgi:hypothetical protein
MARMRAMHASNKPSPIRHLGREISLSKTITAARLWVRTPRRAPMNDDLTRDPGPLGGMLCVFLALVILLIV